jgi:hypothetical protein
MESTSSKGNIPCPLYVQLRSLTVLCSIRYAAPPIGNLRFAAPQPPIENRTASIPATTDGPACPQSGAGKETPAAYGFTSALGNEDCLFLNVYAPANATDLPVFFWIRKFAIYYIDRIFTHFLEMVAGTLSSALKASIQPSLSPRTTMASSL